MGRFGQGTARNGKRNNHMHSSDPQAGNDTALAPLT
jgi:hypothetical protein